MADVYKVQTVKKYGSRVKESFAKSMAGLVMFLTSFVVLFTNEGYSIRQHKMLKTGLARVVSVSTVSTSDENENKLIHINGQASTNVSMQDEDFGLSVDAIALRRVVYMYQWVEKKEETSTVKYGGSEVIDTTYSYVKEWSTNQIDSTKFYKPEYHNPEFSVLPYTQYSNRINVEAFSVSEELVKKLDSFEELALLEEVALPSGQSLSVDKFVPSGYVLLKNSFYNGLNIEEPKIGDVIVSFEYIPLQPISVIGKQLGGVIVPFETKYGDLAIAMLGDLTSKEMIQKEIDSNKAITWAVRIGGFMMMFVGLKMFVSLIVTILSVLPFLSKTFYFTTTPILFVISAILSLITISLSWLFFRPLLSFSILFVVFVLWRKMREMKAQRKIQLQKELDEKNEGKFAGVAKLIEGTCEEINEKKDKIVNIIKKI